MLRNNVVFVLKRARIVPYASSRSRLPYWSHNKKVLSAGEDIFTDRNGCLKVIFHLLHEGFWNDTDAEKEFGSTSVTGTLWTREIAPDFGCIS